MGVISATKLPVSINFTFVFGVANVVDCSLLSGCCKILSVQAAFAALEQNFA
jgi:hypothetical protein